MRLVFDATQYQFKTSGTERLRIHQVEILVWRVILVLISVQLDGMVINTGSGYAGLLINSSSSSHNAYLGFSYGSGSSTSHADQYSAYIGRVGDNTLVLGTNNSTRIYVTSDGDVAIGRDAALNNYAAGSTTTQLAVVKDGGAAGSGNNEVAHFTGGTDSNDTGAIVIITQFNNDRGLYIKGGRGTGDQAKAIFGLRNSANSDSDVMIFEQGGRVTIPGQPSFAAYQKPQIVIPIRYYSIRCN